MRIRGFENPGIRGKCSRPRPKAKDEVMNRESVIKDVVSCEEEENFSFADTMRCDAVETGPPSMMEGGREESYKTRTQCDRP